MVLMGKYKTIIEALPTIIPELQNRSVISVISGNNHLGALTSSGKLLTWGEYCLRNLDLGDPHMLPAGSPGGYTIDRAYESSPYVTVPIEVRFNHGLTVEGRVKKYCFAAAMGGDSTAALVVDLAEDEVPPEGLKLYS